jgi:shikimate kinase
VRVLLLGLPGAGATTVGGLLSKRLGWPFLDAPALLERTGSASRALTLLLGMPGPLVAALPGEVVDEDDDVARLASGGSHVVWLRCSVPVLARRSGLSAGDEATAQLRRLQAERCPRYEALASQVVDTDAMPAGQSANLVIQVVSPAVS